MISIPVKDNDEGRAQAARVEDVRACAGALTATSANLAGEPLARNAAEVARSFPSGLDLIVDGGLSHGDQPSAVIDLSGQHPRLIREGAV